jgi:N-acetylmuramoyl-L-alanine amidase
MSYRNEPPRDDDRYEPLGEQDPENDGDIPASVAFMEMMRRAAARNQPANPPPSPPTAPRDVQPEVRRRPISRGTSPLVPDNEMKATSPPSPTPETPWERTGYPTEEPESPAFYRVGAATRASREVDDGDDAPATPPPPSDMRRARRRTRRRQRTSMLGGALRPIIIIPVAAALIATIFAWFTPPEMINSEVRSELSADIATSTFATFEPTAAATANWQKRIGIVSGHRGGDVYDPGAVCTDANGEAVRPNENDINFSVAERVVNTLRGMGYTADLLDEFDPRLQTYQAAALVSIHANTCREWPGGEFVSGYLIAAPEARATMRGNDELLVGCIANYYGAMTQLQRRPGVTRDMTDYHNFREIHPQTPAAIIELGFLRADWELLTTQPDLMAQAIINGILCFADPAVAPALPVGTPAPGA